jgi:hypothetical protein
VIRRSPLALALAFAVAAVLPAGCDNQDPGQPPMGSISIKAKPDDMKVTARKRGRAPKRK